MTSILDNNEVSSLKGLGEKFKCVLFDMDGVLYNSMPNHAVAWVRAMKEFGIHFTPEDSYATEGARGVDTIRVYAKSSSIRTLPRSRRRRFTMLRHAISTSFLLLRYLTV